MIGGANFPGYKFLLSSGAQDTGDTSINLSDYVSEYLFSRQSNPQIRGTVCGFAVQCSCILRLVKLDGGDAETAPAPIFIYPNTMFFMNMNLEDMIDWAFFVDTVNTPGTPTANIDFYFVGQN
jgi:hypothetical protein